MVRKEDICILFDSKSSVPKINIRELDEKTINENIDLYAKNIVQMYHRIQDYKFYNPFPAISFNDSNIFGVVVLLEDSYVSRKLIYNHVAELLKIDIQSDEYKYITSNISIVDIGEIEQTALNTIDYTSTLLNRRDKKDYNAFSFDASTSKGLSSIYKSFLDDIYTKHIDKMMAELRNDGVIS